MEKRVGEMLDDEDRRESGWTDEVERDGQVRWTVGTARWGKEKEDIKWSRIVLRCRGVECRDGQMRR